MEEILKKANELGLMLKQTKEFTEFAQAAVELDQNPHLKKLVTQYENMSNTMRQKQELGAIESFEITELNDTYKKVTENQVTLSYIQTRDAYATLLERIQRSLQVVDDNMN